MLEKTRGIVLHYLKYRESSIIARLYTEKLGIQSYIVNGVRSRTLKNQKMALFQPLNLLDLVVYYRPDQNRLNRISELRSAYHFVKIPLDVNKSSIVWFLAEILNKSLKEEGPQEGLFNFLWKSIIHLDQMEKGVENYHLHFLIHMSTYLGFHPQSAEECLKQLEQYKNLGYSPDQKKQLLESLGNLIQAPFSLETRISSWARKQLIDLLLDYYRLHVDQLEVIKSLDVLREMNRS